MISVEAAWHILESNILDFGTELIPFTESGGKVMREDIFADRDFPPFDRVAMDGIAIQYGEIERGVRSFTVHGMAGAGDAQLTIRIGDYCVEIMTGAILPQNADTVVPYEWIRIENGNAFIVTDKKINPGQNVHRRGTDKKQNDLLIPSGHFIGSGEIALFASVGKGIVKVSRVPKVLIASTGNELIAVDQQPLPHQVRRSNVYQLQAMLQQLTIEPDLIHLDDDFEAITKSLSDAILNYDVIILSGGISAGKFDHVPGALENLNVGKLFYKVAQKPGKPFLFGRHDKGCSVFGIPGNPVSSYLCMVRYIIPWLRKCLQANDDKPCYAKLGADINFSSPLTQFMIVRLEHRNDGCLEVMPVKGHGSGDLTSLVGADGFAELPADRRQYFRGDVVRVWL